MKASNFQSAWMFLPCVSEFRCSFYLWPLIHFTVNLWISDPSCCEVFVPHMKHKACKTCQSSVHVQKCDAKQNNVCCKARAFASAYAMQQLLSSTKRADRVQADEQALQSLCSSDCFQYKVSPKIRSWEIPPLAVIQTHINTFM